MYISNFCNLYMAYNLTAFLFSFLFQVKNNFTYLGSSTEITFWAVGYCSPPSPRTPFTYIMYNMTIHSYAKGFLGTRGGTMLNKYFSIFLYV